MNEDDFKRILQEQLSEFRGEVREQLGEARSEMREQLTKFSLHFDARLDNVEQELTNFRAETRERFDRVNTQLDEVRGLLDTDELERGSMGVQLDRHDDWITRAAKQTGVRYSGAA